LRLLSAEAKELLKVRPNEAPCCPLAPPGRVAPRVVR